MPIPQTIGLELLDELNGYVAQDAAPDQFTQARFQRKIDQLLSKAPGEAHLCSAILHTLNKQADEMRECYRQAFFYLPNNADMHYNFASSLSRLGFCNEALDQYMMALAINRASRELVKDIAIMAHTTFRVDALLEALELYVKATMDDSVSEESSVQAALDLASLMQESSIEPTSANLIYQAAESVMLKNSTSVEQIQCMATGDFGGSVISMFAGVQTDADLAMQMNMDLADELVRRDLLHLLPSVTYAFTPVSNTI